MTPSWLSEIDHTGDVGIAVTAPDVETLFERAAWAMFTILTDPTTVEPTDRITLEVEATDRDDLLVRWLSELNFLHITTGMLLASFDITGMSECRLSAVVRGEPMDERHHVVHTEIKAVTYHQLRLERTSDGWLAEVILDI